MRSRYVLEGVPDYPARGHVGCDGKHGLTNGPRVGICSAWLDVRRARDAAYRRARASEERGLVSATPFLPETLPPATGRIPTGESIPGVSDEARAVSAPFGKPKKKKARSREARERLREKRLADAGIQPEPVLAYWLEGRLGAQRVVARGKTDDPVEREGGYNTHGIVVERYLELLPYDSLRGAFLREFELDVVIREHYAALGLLLGPTASSEVYAIYEVAPEDPDVVRARDDAYLDEPRGLRDLGAGPDE